MYLSSIIYRIVTEQADKREIRDLFGKYVSPEVASEILKATEAEELKLGGEQRDVAVLFADLRGFTALSEQMTPESVVDMLNAHFSVIIEKILIYKGVVNKFTGDNVMAVWNAPQSQPEHAFSPVKAALEAQQAIAELEQSRPDLPKVQFGFGISTGEVFAGNVGSKGRLEYTVIGDTVNLASRICGAAPGGQVWISSETYNYVKDKFEVKELEPQYFKGKAAPVVVYQVLRERTP